MIDPTATAAEVAKRLWSFNMRFDEVRSRYLAEGKAMDRNTVVCDGKRPDGSTCEAMALVRSGQSLAQVKLGKRNRRAEQAWNVPFFCPRLEVRQQIGPNPQSVRVRGRAAGSGG